MFRPGRSTARAALLVAVAAASVFLAAPIAAGAEIVTVCGIHDGHAAALPGTSDFQLSRLLASTGSIEPVGNGSIALTRDGGEFDLIVNWRQKDEHSLRAAGIDILGMELGSLVHLMVASEQKPVEHYLFTLDEDGAGDLLWSSGVSSRQGDVSSSFACAKPR